jgi:hypothetical protein
MTKRVNPYTALRSECREWARTVKYADKREFCYWEDLNGVLQEILVCAQTANALGYDAVFVPSSIGERPRLALKLVKRPPEPPWAIR